MSKELEASKRIRKLLENKYGLLIYADDLDLIETALKRLENYEQNEDFNKDVLNYAFLNEQDKIKKLKALDIIKEKKVNVLMFICYANSGKNGFKMYNQAMENEEWRLTQEEFDLLKEVLE